MVSIGIDIGGTFTDVVCQVGTNRLFYAKAPSSPDVVQGVLNGVAIALAKAGLDPDHKDIVHLHGTTVATNALLEHKGATTAILATNGHEDALEIGRQKRSNVYDLFLEPETPGFLSPRRMRVGIRERMDGAGKVLTPLDEEQVIAEVGRLIEEYAIQAVAVCYLNSYINNLHEERTLELLTERYPELTVSISSRVNPVFREYERTCCTAFDAYVRPIVENYVRQLQSELGSNCGDRSDLHLMQSRGGISSAEMAIRRPVTMVLSGPAAGVVGAGFVGSIADRRNLITFDAGGTSTDVSVIENGEPHHTPEGRLGKYPLRLPMIDIATIGSGGGSIAWTDDGGGLHVGPQSAGSTPGPACYGRSGEEPTATDASLVLGYLNPDYFAEGNLKLDPALAHAAVEKIAGKVGMSVTEAALGIHRISNTQMAEAIRLVTVKRGVDPRGFSIVAFGGAGPVHAAAIADELGIGEVIVPGSPGTLSALGLLVSDFECDGVRTMLGPADRFALETIEAAYLALEKDGESRLEREGIEGRPISNRRTIELRYIGQSYEIEVPMERPVTDASMEAAKARFHAAHGKLYGHADQRRPIELVNIRTVTFQVLDRPTVEAVAGPAAKTEQKCEPGSIRDATFHGVGTVETPVYRRSDIPRNARIAGPAIIEQADTTTVVYPGQVAETGSEGILLVRSQAEGNGRK
jgi:N-methylhydantoinase A